MRTRAAVARAWEIANEVNAKVAVRKTVERMLAEHASAGEGPREGRPRQFRRETPPCGLLAATTVVVSRRYYGVKGLFS